MVTVELLRQYLDTKGVADATLQEIAGLCESKHYEANDIIYRADEASDHLFVVHTGQVDVQYLLASGRRMTVDTLNTGDFMVWSAVVPPHTTTSIGICRAKAELIAIPGPQLRALCDKDTAFGYRLSLQMARVIRRRLQAARLQIAGML